MELLQSLSQQDLIEMQSRFGEDGLEVDEFVDCFSELLKEKAMKGLASEDVLLRWNATSLSNLFREVDYNSDGSVTWDEFTSFAISVALTGGPGPSGGGPTGFKEYIPSQFQLPNQSAKLRTLSYIPGAEKFVASGFTKTTVHDVDTLKECGQLAIDGRLIDSAYVGHLSLLVTSSDANYIQFFDSLDNYSCRKTFSANNAVVKWLQMPNSTLGQLRLFCGDRVGCLNVLGLDRLRSNANTGTSLSSITLESRPLHTDTVTGMLYVEHSAKSSIFSSSMDNSMVLSDPETGKMTMSIVNGHDEYIRSISMSNTHRIGVACGSETFATAFSIDHRQRAPFYLQDVRLPHTHNLVGVHCVPNTHQIITADSGGTFKLWDARQYQCVQTFQLPRNEATIATVTTSNHKSVQPALNPSLLDSVFLDTKRSLVALGKTASTIFKYDNRQTARTVHAEPVASAMYSAQTQTLITVTVNEVRVWSILSGKCVATFEGFLPGEEVTKGVLDPVSGRRLLLGTASGKIVCMLPTTGKIIWRHDVVDRSISKLGDYLDEVFVERQQPSSESTPTGEYSRPWRSGRITMIEMIDRRSFVIGTASGELFLWFEEYDYPQERLFPPKGDVVSLDSVENRKKARELRLQYESSLEPLGPYAHSLIAGIVVFSMEKTNRLMAMETKSKSVAHMNDANHGPQTQAQAITFVQESASGGSLSLVAVSDQFGAVHIWSIRGRNIFGASTLHIATVHTPQNKPAMAIACLQQRYLVGGTESGVAVTWDLKGIVDAVSHYVSPDGTKARKRSSEFGTLGSKLVKAAERGMSISSAVSEEGALKFPRKRSSAMSELATEMLEEECLKIVESRVAAASVDRIFFTTGATSSIALCISLDDTGLMAFATAEDDPEVIVMTIDGERCGLVCQGRADDDDITFGRSSSATLETSSVGVYRVRDVLAERAPLLSESQQSVEEFLLRSSLPAIDIELDRIRAPEISLQEMSRKRRKKRRHHIKHKNRQHVRNEVYDKHTPRIVQDLLDMEWENRLQSQRSRKGVSRGNERRTSLDVSYRRRFNAANMITSDEEEDRTKVPSAHQFSSRLRVPMVPQLIPQASHSNPSTDPSKQPKDGKRRMRDFIPVEKLLDIEGGHRTHGGKANQVEVSLRQAVLDEKEDLRVRAREAAEERSRRNSPRFVVQTARKPQLENPLPLRDTLDVESLSRFGIGKTPAPPRTARPLRQTQDDLLAAQGFLHDIVSVTPAPSHPASSRNTM